MNVVVDADRAIRLPWKWDIESWSPDSTMLAGSAHFKYFKRWRDKDHVFIVNRDGTERRNIDVRPCLVYDHPIRWLPARVRPDVAPGIALR